MKYIPPDDASKKPGVGFVLPMLVLVIWVYGDTGHTQYTPLTRTINTGKSLISPGYPGKSVSSKDFALSPVSTVPVLLFVLVLGAFYKIPGTGKPFIGKPFSRVLAVRGPPF